MGCYCWRCRLPLHFSVSFLDWALCACYSPVSTSGYSKLLIFVSHGRSVYCLNVVVFFIKAEILWIMLPFRLNERMNIHPLNYGGNLLTNPDPGRNKSLCSILLWLVWRCASNKEYWLLGCLYYRKTFQNSLDHDHRDAW